MTTMTSTPTLRSNFSVLMASMKMRFITITRYKGQVITDIIVPIVLAAMPILLGRATAGDDAGAIFKARTGTDNYVAYMMIGSSTYTIVSYAFWHVANWLRWEMQTGTIEALYLAPTSRAWVAGGVAAYSMIRSIIASFVSFFLGSFILGVNPFQGELLLALLFILVGLLPIYGMAMLFGAIILKLKEANAVISLMQWVVSFLMGVYFPVAIFPPLIRVLAMAFPPTWMTNGVRSALLGVGFFFGEWYLDLAVLWVFLAIAPFFGLWIFSKVETSVRRNEGVGQY